MNKMNFTPFPKLMTEHLCLRQITNEDLDEFYILKSDERLLKWYDAKAKTYEEASQKLQRDNEGIAKNEWIIWGITLKNDNKLIGSICFWNIIEVQLKAEIGYELMVDWHGKGIMQEAIEAVIAYGFNDMKLQIIEGFPNPNNESSVKLLERSGFAKGEKFYDTDPSNGKLLERITYLLVKRDL